MYMNRTTTWHKGALIRFVGILLPILILVAIGYQFDRRAEKQRLLTEHRHLAHTLSVVLDSNLSGLVTDLKILRDSAEVHDYLAFNDGKSRQRLQQRFLSFASSTGRYDQIRLIDSEGMERVRVHGQSGTYVVSPQNRLQDKSGRYYVDNTMSLGEGEVYVSQFDLNVERGVVEEPWKPMIRLGTPLVNSQGQKVAMLILNYLGDQLLQTLRQEEDSLRGDIALLNDNGQWLFGPHKHLNWNFMFGGEENFGKQFPGVWKQLESQGAGQTETPGRVFTYTTIDSPAKTNGAPPAYPHTDRWWKLMITLPRDYWSTRADQRLDWFLYSLPFLCLLIGFVSWRWAAISVEAHAGRKRIEELSRVVEQSEEIVFITDKEGVIQYVNPAFERVTGYAEREALGNTPRLIKSGNTDKAVYEDLWSVILRGRPFQTVITNRRKDGTLYYEEKLITPILDQQGDIVQFVSTGRDISSENQLLKLTEQLRNIAYTDALTGLPNRTQLDESLKTAMARAKRFKELMAVLFIDLDCFKLVNDKLGHDAGDLLLVSFADLLRTNLRETDASFRYGGDEFLVILEGFDRVEDVEHTVSKILKKICDAEEFKVSGLQVGASIGVTIYPFDDSLDATELIRQADCAMYHAKLSGKRGYAFFNPEMKGLNKQTRR